MGPSTRHQRHIQPCPKVRAWFLRLCSKHGWLQTPDVQGVRGMNGERKSPGRWAEKQGHPIWRHGPKLPQGEHWEEGKQVFCC